MKVNSIKNRRGFTVVELVVAITIIVIVSATAIGLINTQNKIHQQTMQTVEATNMAENAIECFRVTSGEAEFKVAYAKTFTDKARPTDLLNFETNGMTVTITISENTLTFKAVAAGDKIILEKSYTK
jgi:prepilin-type N-terminal cleavage/methylation domain-containing protein